MNIHNIDTALLEEDHASELGMEETLEMAVEALKNVPDVYWCSVKDINWLSEYFNMNSHAVREITDKLYALSDRMNLPARRSEDEWLFHCKVVYRFRYKVIADPRMLGKYRLA